MVAPFALTNANIVVGDKAATVLPNMTVLVDSAGLIEEVAASTEAKVPSGHRAFDLTGKFLLPGLINAHAHLFADGKPLPPLLTSESMEKVVAKFMHGPIGQRVVKARTKRNVITQLNSGVTTLRSLGDVRYEAVEVRDQIERGEFLGPRMLTSGPLMAVSGGHGAPSIALVGDSPWDHRRNVRLNLRKGVNAIKIAVTGGVTDARAIGEAGRPQMSEEEMAAICDEAHQAGVLVAAHAQSPEGILAALRAGVDTIEHGSGMTAEIVDLFHHNPKSLYGSSALIPTLQACLPLVKLDQTITGINNIVKANGEMIFESMLQGISDALEHGITIGMGTDSALTYVTHYNTWREMDYVVRYGGLSKAQAINAATQSNAALLGLQKITGSIEAGLAADLVVLGANPLDDLRAFADPELVIAGGAVIENPTVSRFDEIDAHLDSF